MLPPLTITIGGTILHACVPSPRHQLGGALGSVGGMGSAGASLTRDSVPISPP
jgi:hypothetical protein